MNSSIHRTYPETNSSPSFPLEKWWLGIIQLKQPFKTGCLEFQVSTLPETNIAAPENGWMEYYFPFGEAYFQGRAVSFLGGYPFDHIADDA